MTLPILYQDSDILIVIKPRGLDSAPVVGGRIVTLCSLVFDAISPESARVAGRRPEEGGLLHRLDYDTEGPVLFAKTQRSFDFLMRQAQAGKFIKKYLARCHVGNSTLAPQGLSPLEWQSVLAAGSPGGSYRLRCRFVYSDNSRRVVRAVAADSRSTHASEIYTTDFTMSRIGSGVIEVVAGLTHGYRHQIRASLAALGLPIIMDPLYDNAEEIRPQEFAFWAVSIQIPLPGGSGERTFSYEPTMV